MAEYNVGDKVKIVENLDEIEGINEDGEMNYWAGKVMTISSNTEAEDEDDDLEYQMVEDNREWYWSNAMIEGRVE